jgi:XXXCH domain-containing protein
MDERPEREFSREDLADYLEKLAKQLRRGAFDTERGVRPVPERIGAKIHIKEKKGRIVAKINLEWSMPHGEEDGRSEEPLRNEANFKQVKKKLNTLFKEMRSTVNRGDFPDEKGLADFIEISRTFSGLAEPEWKKPVQEYMDHLQNLESAVRDRKLEMVQHELRDLTNRMATCHREFK